MKLVYLEERRATALRQRLFESSNTTILFQASVGRSYDVRIACSGIDVLEAA